MFLNILNFEFCEALASCVNVTVATKRGEFGQFGLIHRDECPSLWSKHPELKNQHELYFSLTPSSECSGNIYNTEINFLSNRRLKKIFIKRVLFKYFKNYGIVNFNYVRDLEVWIKDTSYLATQNSLIDIYDRYSLVPKLKVLSDGWELRISYNGTSAVYKKTLCGLDLKTSNFRVVALNCNFR